jgi:hypothetical protein
VISDLPACCPPSITVERTPKVSKAAGPQVGVVRRLVKESVRGHNYKKAIKCLRHLRRECKQDDDTEAFNTELKKMKQGKKVAFKSLVSSACVACFYRNVLVASIGTIRHSRLSLTGRVLLRWHVLTEYEPGTPGHGFWISIKENGVSLLSTEDCEESEVSETARHEMIQKTLQNLLFLVFEWSVAKL